MPSERSARALAAEYAPNMFDPKYAGEEGRAKYAADVRANNESEGVRDDAEVRTDATTAVVQETDEWRARWVIAEQDGRPVARSLTIEPTVQRTPPGGVTSNLLRELSSSQAIAAVNERLQRPLEADWPVGLNIKWARRDIEEMIEAPSDPTPKPGRPRLSDELLRDVAIAYLEEQARGRGVLRRLAERFNRPEPTLRDWVRLARVRQWLGPAPKQGRGGGGPGPRLLTANSEDES